MFTRENVQLGDTRQNEIYAQQFDYDGNQF